MQGPVAYLPVFVLAGPESMCHALQSIHKWAGAVVCWVHLHPSCQHQCEVHMIQPCYSNSSVSDEHALTIIAYV